MSPIYLLALAFGLGVMVYEWRRHQDEHRAGEADEPQKLKNEASFRYRFFRFFQPNQRGEYFTDDRPFWLTGIFRVLKIVYIIFIAFALTVAFVPLVQWAFGVPPNFEGSLSDYSPAASDTLAGIFFISMVIGIAFLRRWPWRVWNAILALSLIFFIVTMILYENLY